MMKSLELYELLGSIDLLMKDLIDRTDVWRNFPSLVSADVWNADMEDANVDA